SRLDCAAERRVCGVCRSGRRGSTRERGQSSALLENADSDGKREKAEGEPLRAAPGAMRAGAGPVGYVFATMLQSSRFSRSAGGRRKARATPRGPPRLLLVQARDLGAFERKIVHEALVRGDEADDRLLAGVGIERSASPEACDGDAA